MLPTMKHVETVRQLFETVPTSPSNAGDLKVAPDQILKRRQEVGAQVEQKMLDFLLQYTPARELKLGDAHCIANAARLYAFDATTKIFETPTTQ